MRPQREASGSGTEPCARAANPAPAMRSMSMTHSFRNSSATTFRVRARKSLADSLWSSSRVERFLVIAHRLSLSVAAHVAGRDGPPAAPVMQEPYRGTGIVRKRQSLRWIGCALKCLPHPGRVRIARSATEGARCAPADPGRGLPARPPCCLWQQSVLPTAMARSRETGGMVGRVADGVMVRQAGNTNLDHRRVAYGTDPWPPAECRVRHDPKLVPRTEPVLPTVLPTVPIGLTKPTAGRRGLTVPHQLRASYSPLGVSASDGPVVQCISTAHGPMPGR